MLAYTTGVVAVAFGIIAGVSFAAAVAALKASSGRRTLGVALGGLTAVTLVGFALLRTTLAAVVGLRSSEADWPILIVSLGLGLLAGRLLLRRAERGRRSTPRVEGVRVLGTRRTMLLTVVVLLAISIGLVVAIDLARSPGERAIAKTVPDACSMSGKIDAEPGNSGYVTITWAVVGGCQPYSGMVIVNDAGSATATYAVHSASGSIDYQPPPSPCFVTLRITLNMTDSTQHQATATAQLSVQSCRVANVYNLPQAVAEGTLHDQGLATRAFQVCSGSVAAGRVREAVFVRQDDSELILVDEKGVTGSGEQVTRDTLVTLKISTGVACH